MFVPQLQGLFCVLQVLLNFKRWRIEEYQQVINGITSEDLTAFIPRLFRRAFLEALVVGNFSPEEADQISQTALEALSGPWGTRGLFPGEEKDLRMIKLPQGVSTALVEPGPNPTNDNSAAVVVYQVCV